ncbi:MAG: clan AA aspartic protease [Elusimicrobia bacterium]|nr:clan AA aspartic protease [Elusimicrobiota bacterium]
MPSFPFDATKSIIICHVEISGPKTEFSLKMAVDTGATYTAIPLEAAVGIGCSPLRFSRKIEITMGGSIEYVPFIIIPKIRAFGIELKNFPVICHNLPQTSPVEGLLGLNFLEGAKIIIDFTKHVMRTP